MSPDFKLVLDFWFTQEEDEVRLINKQSPLWWGKSNEMDGVIKTRFTSLLNDIKQGELESWRFDPGSRLAMILVCDQFSRQIYRDKAEAFASDEIALDLCLDGLDKGMDQKLRSIERVFFYMPMEHSESLSIQNRCVQQFQKLLDEVGPELKPEFEGFVSFAKQHQKIIKRFNRFPHRNSILGRKSTADEAAFLLQPNSSY